MSWIWSALMPHPPVLIHELGLNNPTTLKKNSSWRDPVIGITLDSLAYQLLFRGSGSSAEQYWLASPYISCTQPQVYFGYRYINYEVKTDSMVGSGENPTNALNKGVRPVVTLQSDVRLIIDDENEGYLLSN